MKKIFFLLFLVACSNIYAEQPFAPIGTEWYYGETIYPVFSNTEIKAYDYNLLKSVRDTTINGRVCNTIARTKGTRLCIPIDSAFVYQSNDTVYYYNTELSIFSPLYVFGANKGDSWTVRHSVTDVQVIVDSVSTIQAFGHTLKVQYVTYKTQIGSNPSYPVSYSSKIIENIGDVDDFFRFEIHEMPTCDEFGIVHTGLRCYIHPNLGTYNTGVNSCDYVTEVPRPEISKIKISKIPGVSLCVESLDDEISSIQLFDLRGQTICKKQNLAGKRHEIPIVYSGIMISIIELQSGEIIVRKI